MELVSHIIQILHLPLGYGTPLKMAKKLINITNLEKHITLKFIKSCVTPYFTIGNRYISVLHARFRNRCSNLNSDLFRNYTP